MSQFYHSKCRCDGSGPNLWQDGEGWGGAGCLLSDTDEKFVILAAEMILKQQINQTQSWGCSHETVSCNVEMVLINSSKLHTHSFCSWKLSLHHFFTCFEYLLKNFCIWVATEYHFWYQFILTSMFDYEKYYSSSPAGKNSSVCLFTPECTQIWCGLVVLCLCFITESQSADISRVNKELLCFLQRIITTGSTSNTWWNINSEWRKLGTDPDAGKTWDASQQKEKRFNLKHDDRFFDLTQQSTINCLLWADTSVQFCHKFN